VTAPAQPPLDEAALRAAFPARADPQQNPVHEIFAHIANALSAQRPSFNNGQSAEQLALAIETLVAPVTPAEHCIAPTLACLGWAGEIRRIREALPHFDQVGDIETLRSVLVRLGYRTIPIAHRLADISDDRLPCLMTFDRESISLVAERQSEGNYLVYDGQQGAWQSQNLSKSVGCVYALQKLAPEEYQTEAQQPWFRFLWTKFKWVMVSAILLSFAVNLTALAVPTFVIHVYDLGIGTKSSDVVMLLAAGAGIVITTDFALRSIRARLMAYFGARLDALISMGAFQQLLRIPIAMVESASVGTQVSRLRQFESVRDVFTGTLSTAIIDIPFIFVFMTAIAYWGGHLVWIPLTLSIIYIVLSVTTLPIVRRYGNAAGAAKQRLQLLLLEIVGKRRSIRSLNAEEAWVTRHRECVNEAAKKNQSAQFLNSIVQNVAQTLVSISGAATLGLGTLMVINNTMSLGALVGVMALVWRVLAPLQSTYLSVTRLEQSFETFRQINRLMAIPPEADFPITRSFNRQFQGQIILNRLVFRYPRRSDPALRGIVLQINPGESVAITGPSGAGKSTVLKLMVGLYPPLGGAVLADGLDLRQINPAEWRSEISYMPETATFFYGTVAQNFRLVRPDATDDEIVRALADMDISQKSAILPNVLETRLTASLLEKLPDGFKQRLALARCFIKNSPVYLIDNPSANLDAAGEACLVRKLNALKGRSTVVLTTFRPSHMRIADRVVLMRDGLIAADGPPDKIIPQISAVA
jgi:ATP-binding cassette subfamily C protein LapB